MSPLRFDPDDFFSLDNGATFEQPRTGETVPTNAIQSMQPVTASSDSLGSWGGFIQDSLRGVLGYSIARDAARNGVRSPSGQYYGQPEQQMQHVGQGQAMAPVQQRNPLQGLLMPALLVAGVVLVAKLAK